MSQKHEILSYIYLVKLYGKLLAGCKYLSVPINLSVEILYMNKTQGVLSLRAERAIYCIVFVFYG